MRTALIAVVRPPIAPKMFVGECRATPNQPPYVSGGVEEAEGVAAALSPCAASALGSDSSTARAVRTAPTDRRMGLGCVYRDASPGACLPIHTTGGTILWL